ncbi:MAG: hypothetical protein WBK47_01170 [Acetomicrobium sp.]|jgi:hypothetical protein
MVQKQEQNIFIGKNPRPENVEYIALEGYVRNVRPFKIFENEDGKIYHTMCIMAAKKREEEKYTDVKVFMKTSKPPLFLLEPDVKLELFGYYFSNIFRAVKAKVIRFKDIELNMLK